MKKLLTFVGGAVATCLAYGTLVEPRDFRIRTARVPILPADSQPLVALHISDIHLLARQYTKLEFLKILELLEPDFVISTGDNISEAEAVLPLIDALGGLFEIPGFFVFGSNDYYGPKLKNPFRYLWKSTAISHEQAKSKVKNLPAAKLATSFSERGWINLMERKHRSTIGGQDFEFRGTSDAHISLDNYAAVAGKAPKDVISIGVTHAPYARVLKPMVADGLDLIFAGHTHGGQVCVPGFGALTTNCDLPLKKAKGLSVILNDDKKAYLHVSGGLGASPFAPFRFANPPEVTLLTLMPVNDPGLRR